MNLIQSFLTHWQDFHWLRPLWLLLIPLSALIVIALWRQHQRRGDWQQIIDPKLLPYLLEGKMQRQQKWPLYALLAALTLAALTIAGPTWEKIPQPIHKTESALVVMLDLSPSMNAEDLKPSRLIRARLKLTDLLKQRQEGLTALIAYAGEAHIVTPLTDDTDTIISLLPALSPGVMPLQGSNPEMAIELAQQLFSDAGLNQGELLLITDGVTDEAIGTINDDLKNQFRLSVLGVGTDSGAPIPIRQGGFAKDNGAIVIAKLGSSDLDQLAQNNGGIFRKISANDKDLGALLAQPDLMDERTRELERQFDIWFERGPYLALLLLPFAAFAFRRGWIASLAGVMLITGSLTPQTSYAFGWNDIWLRKDQQGQKLLEQQQAADAAETFKDSQWRGSAYYQNGDFEKAEQQFSEQDTADSNFNRGNALAKSQKLEDAIAAYDRALELNPDMEDAKANKELLEKLKQQQEQEQENQQGSDQQNQDQQNQNQQSSDQQNQDQQGNNSQSGQNQSSDNQQQNSDSQQDQESNQDQEQEQDQQRDQDSAQDQQNQEQQTQEQQATDAPSGKDNQASNKQEKSDQSAEQQTDDTESSPESTMAAGESDKESDEALEQWLRKVPDDPSGLMKRKFNYQHNLRRKQYRDGNWEPPENEANKRW
jgi:Ca-activated chloride channel homolog